MGQKLQELLALIATKGLKYVGTRGNTNAPLCVVGESPGADEDACGYPFVGASGREQDRMLTEAGISQDEVWFTNPYKTRPPENEIDRLDELGIPRSAFEEQFYEELREAKPKVIIAAGATPLSLLCPSCGSGKDNMVSIGKWRGSLLTSPFCEWPHYVIPCYHPAFILREYSERQVSVFVLQRAKEEVDFILQHGHLQPLPERELIAEPSYEQATEYLDKCLASPDPISVDIEMLRRRLVYTISFALSPCSAISLEFAGQFLPQQQAVLLRKICLILSTKRIIGQNYINFDANWLEFFGFRVEINNVEDTIVRHHILWPELEHSLQFMCMQYTREIFYKDEGKQWNLKKEGKTQLKRYNCKDTCVTYEVYLEQEKEFNERSVVI
jgi:uracil-DNA glycosylase family 4